MRLAILSHILDGALVPFLARHYPTAHRFQQDNDPKHISRWAQNYFEENGINWWKTPASSPDLNPIENVCGSMKNHLRTNGEAKKPPRVEGWDQRILANTNSSCLQEVFRTLEESNPQGD